MDIDIFSWKHETVASGIKPIQSKHDRSKASTELATQFCPKGKSIEKEVCDKNMAKTSAIHENCPFRAFFS